MDAPRERWIEIRTDSGTLVTIIEILSPTNKTHGRAAYQNKRCDFTDAGVNVVGIDLLRGGELTVDVDGTDYGPLVGGKGEHYVVCVRRAARPMPREVSDILTYPPRSPRIRGQGRGNAMTLNWCFRKISAC